MRRSVEIIHKLKVQPENSETETLEAVADRGYFNSPEILACHEGGITVTLPKPLTSGAKSEGRFGAGVCLFAGRKRLSLPSWRAAAISLHERRRRQDAAALLDHGMSKLLTRVPMHERAGAADYTMGA